MRLKKQAKEKRNTEENREMEIILDKFSLAKKRAIERSIVSKTKYASSSWLSVLPTKKDHFDLSLNEF